MTVGAAVKRTFDLVVSVLALVVLFPLGLAIAALIRIDSRGPVFYRGQRIGLRMRPFRIFKFRTMVPDAELRGGPSTAHHDPRLTRVGIVLRRYKLDELPQVLNILRGDMSVVGPRPQVEMYTSLYSEQEQVIFDVRPGLTDYASIRFINLDELLGDHDVDERYRQQVEPIKNRLRAEYVEQQSLWVDIKILWWTALAFVRHARTPNPEPRTPNAEPRTEPEHELRTEH